MNWELFFPRQKPLDLSTGWGYLLTHRRALKLNGAERYLLFGTSIRVEGYFDTGFIAWPDEDQPQIIGSLQYLPGRCGCDLHISLCNLLRFHAFTKPEEENARQRICWDILLTPARSGRVLYTVDAKTLALTPMVTSEARPLRIDLLHEVLCFGGILHHHRVEEFMRSSYAR